MAQRKKSKAIYEESILISELDPKSPAVESYKLLRTNINFASTDKPLEVIGITSSGPGEGKSTVAANLAIAMAQSNKSVLLLDTDLRRSQQHKIFRFRGRPAGITEILTDARTLQECCLETHVEGLSLIPAGATPPNPSELLGSQKMANLVAELKNEFDLIITDLPPVISVTDALVMSPLVDGFVFVISSGSTDKRAASSAIDMLENAKANIIGAVLNRAEPGKSYGSYYAHYYYSYYTNDDD